MKSDTNKLLSALCYFSVFFAGFILPVAVYFIVDDSEVKRHAKHALVSHILPFVTIPLFVFVGWVTGFGDALNIVIILAFIFTFIVNIVIVIWNVIKGIQVIRTY
ncbi:DUF4870 domain-containing protein [Bacillus sp. BGMRC 2118]|nr:DUF4870 domain-containing protein [Bacillus sp. BGMRC 2118]